MAERKATNKYYPPDWDPKNGSINKHMRSHPLRDRARKLDQGILVVRFEMPFNIWCSGCDKHIGMGVRFNAEKRKIGNYYTSPIYQFKMKCLYCKDDFVIQTDPSKFDYVIVSGARRQASHHDGEQEGLIELESDQAKEKRMTDAMFRLEKRVEDEIKSKDQLPSLIDLKKWRSRWDDSFAINKLARSRYRERRKEIEKAKGKDKKLLKKASLSIPLLDSSPSDMQEARKILESGPSKCKLEPGCSRSATAKTETNQSGTLRPKPIKVKKEP